MDTTTEAPLCPACGIPGTAMPKNKNYGEGRMVYRCTSGLCRSGWEIAVLREDTEDD